MKTLKRCILMGALIVATFMLTGCGKTTVNLNDYVSIKTEGYDSIGTAEIVFDYEKFDDDFDGKIKRDGKEVDTDRFLEKCIEEMTLSQTSGLSNGDVVTLEWEVDEDRALEKYNCELEYSDIEFEITDLTPVQDFNPFDYITVSFSGMEPNGQMTYDIEDRAEFSYISVSSDKSYNLKIGDEVTVTVDVWDEYALIKECGVRVSETTKTYTITRLDEYVTSMDQVSKESMDKLIDLGEAAVYDSAEYEDSIQEVTYVGYYFLTNSNPERKSDNYIYLLYKVNGNGPKTGESYEYYMHIRYKEFKLKTDDTCSVPSSYFYVGDMLSIDNCTFWGFKTVDAFVESVMKQVGSTYTYTTDME